MIQKSKLQALSSCIVCEQEVGIERGENNEFLSGFGKAYEFLKAIIDAVLELGGNDEDLTRVISNKKLAKQIAELIVGKAQKVVEEVYTAIIDYSLGLPKMIKVGNYDWVNDDITSKHFPIEGAGQVKVEFELVHLNRSASSRDALDEMERLGLRAARIKELLAFGAKYSELQRQFPIICLGSVWRGVNDNRYVPYLSRSGDERKLSLDYYDHDWYDSCRFLAVRK